MYKKTITYSEAKGKGAYYVVIPYPILSDETLPDKAKILYGHISALTYLHKHCFASNAFLSNRMGISKQYISELVTKLKNAGFIEVTLSYKPGTKEVQQRLITLGNIPAPTIEDLDWWIEEEKKTYTPIPQIPEFKNLMIKKYLLDIKPLIYKQGQRLKRGDFRYSVYRYQIINNENRLIAYNKQIKEVEEIIELWEDIPYTDIKIVLQKYWI